jgi:hypothetical protein
MSSKRQQQIIYDRLLAEYSPQMAKAFMAAMTDAKTAINLKDLIALIEVGDAFGVVDALNIDDRTLFPMTEALRGSYVAGGQSASTIIGRGTFGFSGNTPRATQWIREKSSEMITQISDDTLPLVQDVLSNGRELSQSPRKTAMELIGPRNPNTGRRTQGLIGLNKPQANAVIKAREQLRNLDAEYFQKALRDKRFDRTIAKAIRDEKPLTETQIDQITNRYSERQIQYRAEGIARLETNAGLAAGQDEGMTQLIDAGQVDGVNKVWNWNRGSQKKAREQHQAISGTRIPISEDFVLPDGTRMKHPHDPRGGPEENWGCRCTAFYEPVIEV